MLRLMKKILRLAAFVVAAAHTSAAGVVGPDQFDLVVPPRRSTLVRRRARLCWEECKCDRKWKTKKVPLVALMLKMKHSG